LDRRLGPDRPVAQQAADDAALHELGAFLEAVGRDQVHDDVVVVAGVQSDVVASCLDDCADDVDRLVAVEGSDLDGYDVFDLGELSPEREGEHTSADGGLEVEADNGKDVGDGAAMADQM